MNNINFTNYDIIYQLYNNDSNNVDPLLKHVVINLRNSASYV